MTIRTPGPFQQESAINGAAIVSKKGDLIHTDDAKIFIDGGNGAFIIDQLGNPKVLTVSKVTGAQSAAPHIVFISDDGRPSTAFYDTGRDKWINILDGLEVAA